MSSPLILFTALSILRVQDRFPLFLKLLSRRLELEGLVDPAESPLLVPLFLVDPGKVGEAEGLGIELRGSKRVRQGPPWIFRPHVEGAQPRVRVGKVRTRIEGAFVFSGGALV